MKIEKKVISTPNGKQVIIEKGEGELLILLHGFPDSPRNFINQINFFADKGYRVVAPFLRGYSPENIPDDGVYISAVLGQDVIDLIETLGYKEAVLAGHDWGANAAYTATLINPDRIKKLITASVPYGTFKNSLLTDFTQQKRSWYMYFFQLPFAEAVVKMNDFQLIKNLWRDWSPGDWQYEKYFEEVKNIFSQPGVADSAIRYYRQVFNLPDVNSSLKELQQKIGVAEIQAVTLYIHGENDNCIGVGLADMNKNLFPRGLTTKIIEDAGHFVHLEKPEIFNSLVYEFIK